MIHFLNAYAVGASLDRLEAALQDAHAEGELTPAVIHTLLDGARTRLELSQGMIRPEDDDIDALAVESFDEVADDAAPDPQR